MLQLPVLQLQLPVPRVSLLVLVIHLTLIHVQFIVPALQLPKLQLPMSAPLLQPPCICLHLIVLPFQYFVPLVHAGSVTRILSLQCTIALFQPIGSLHCLIELPLYLPVLLLQSLYACFVLHSLPFLHTLSLLSPQCILFELPVLLLCDAQSIHQCRQLRL